MRSEIFSEEIECRQGFALLAPPTAGMPRNYARDREVDILNLALDITPDFKKRTIAGRADFLFKPIAQSTRTLRLDAVDLTVDSVTSNHKIQNYQVTDTNIVVTFEPPIAAGEEAQLSITYRAEPRLGLYFRTPEQGYKPNDTQLWTQGESEEARHWFPCYDFPNEKFTSEVTCHVPEGMIVLSNGRLLAQSKDARGLATFHWRQDKPHTTYLITLVAGSFKKVEDKYRDVPLAFYVSPSDIDAAPNSFRNTRDVMEFFEKEIDVSFPWAKYDQVCVQDFHWGGMENTSQTTLTSSTLFTEATENIRSSDALVAHEMAHQWFGDLVTCKDWSQVWLNEGFANYYERLYDGHKNGRDSMLYRFYGTAKSIIERTNDTRPIVSRRFDEPEQQFRNYGYLAYGKGSWVLRMLRGRLGDDLYRHCIKTYLERNRFGNVGTEQLAAVIEELSGRSFDQFFDQWIYHAHHPELEVTYAWDEKNKMARLTIVQAQRTSEDVLLFNFPLTIRFKGKFGTRDETVAISDSEGDFYFPLAGSPEIVRIDPNYELLAKINFKLPAAMLAAQLADAGDVIGRLLAVEQLAQKKDRESVTRLKQALESDGFYGVRVEAARALQTIHSDEALAALLETRPTDARVRYQVASALGGFYNSSAYERSREVAKQEKNPDVTGQALRALGAYPKTDVQQTLVQFLDSKSFRDSLVDSAIGAMRRQDDPVYIKPLLEALKRRGNDLTSASVNAGLDCLAYLARNENRKDEVRNFVLDQVQHPRRSTQLAAIAALGTLEDPKAAVVLETFVSAEKDSAERRAAERALEKIRAANRPTDNLRELRQDILDLKKENRELRKDLDTLKKKQDRP
jgi:aminopeptidase N